MIWIVFGAMAVATFLAVGQILVESDPAHARRQIRLAALAVWVFGLMLTLLGKPLYGLTLMGLGALGVFAAPRPKRRSAPSEAHRRRRPSGRRPDFERDANARSGEVGLDPGVMTEQQAYQILGVQPGASTEEISRAHRALMKKIHPDQGGSTDLAALANAAKDFLAKRRHG
ncbi:DnaJ domain-containing protein [Chelatococcus sambhunathii]|uniref:DnaJ domain-containing protein n=1 Tax=Chelatococcus sambhunathii TaxID=363953 RepID=A0ABU1DEA6_9HYPH|nr:DnaJ domain-containing protein [Chelatococcus sambhunathii]